MQLSDAIRIGSMTTKQIRFLGTDGGNGRCALGAAIDATGAQVNTDFVFTQALNLFPIAEMLTIHPVTGVTTMLFQIIIDLNDHCNWSREAIASFVEAIELEAKEYNELSNEVTPIKETALHE